MKIKNISKKALAVVMLLAVLASALMLNTFSAFATGPAPSTGAWDGNEATEFAGGSGTDADPYKIATPQQLALLGKRIIEQTKNSDNVLYTKCSYILTADIALNNVEDQGDTPWYKRTDLKQWNYGAGEVKPANYFTGKLDGNGYTIKGIYIDTDYQCAGLFIGFMGQVVIKNLGIESSYIKSTFTATDSSNQVGAIVGRINNNPGNTVDISNSYVADSVIITGTNVGGFSGEHGAPTKVTITNCFSSAQINATGNKGAFESGAGGENILTVKRSFSTQTNINFVQYKFAKGIYEDCYTLGTATTGITKLTSLNEMTGKKATVTMPALFTGENSAWVALNKMTPQLKKFGVTSSDVWDGTEVAPSLGKGTKEEPYLIFSAEELAYVADQIQNDNVSSYYELREDIYLNDIADPDWQNLVAGKSVDPEKLAKFKQWDYGNCTGNDGRYGLSGRIDGNNHVIRGVYALVDGEKRVFNPHHTYDDKATEYSTAKHTALFRGIIGGGSIIDLGIESSYFSANVADDARVGAFVVYVEQGSINNPDVIINGCYVDNTYICGKQKTGGLIGFSEVKAKDADRELIIENCYSNATLSGGSQGNIIGYAGFGDLITIKNCYGSHAAELIGSFWGKGKGDIETDGYVNCYTAKTTGSTINGITRLTADQMKGANAVGYMGNLFEVDNNTDGIKDWYVMTGETPKLFSFSGRTEAIVMGDFNVDDAVNLLDLVRLAQARAKVEGVAINESNALVLEHEANYTAYLKNHLLTGTAFDKIDFSIVQ